MADREVTIKVPLELVDRSIARLRAAGVAAPDGLLETMLQASAVDTLETIGGLGPVPTALSDVRAARLLELCKLRKEILSDEVVATLFRVMPSTAGSITRRMQATYEATLEEALRAHMIASAKLSYPVKKEEGEAAKHKVTFATAAAYSHALKTIAAAGLTGEISEERPTRAIVFPQEIEVTVDGQKRRIKIAAEVLGLSLQ
jgi:hypothetical protein